MIEKKKLIKKKIQNYKKKRSRIEKNVPFYTIFPKNYIPNTFTFTQK